MSKTNLLAQVAEKKIVPVVKLDRTSDAKPLGEALCAGGLPVAEVTFRTDAAEESIRIMKKEFPEMMVGAGTVVNVEQAKRALDAGASFLVSPGISRTVVEFALDNKLPVFPGTCTPSEVMIAMEYGLSLVKFFPAEQYGGLNTIKALAAPFPAMKFMPTGGINASNILDFLAFDRIIACGGSWMVKDSLIKEGNFAEITRLTGEAVALVSK
ncbi:bifunctional 4-hydroxy-2-oxoglutarate aldolase/2-dehydro-3-deoxy-phosphogluconate aldolase [Faecalicatena contorta]|uniref:2-dehydro-3-deoxy-phosphogluconate aldolase n=1 Tax=Faecalicatena contorta TaxID=39482 RepID=A0A315ZY43_9FIRM|nr:bifunctional 4-hydroxy-2-oxoglutarate aldolase/2-dehydro-3-deoxy-phosphogluconate aldolase [Faecalicatena contorta]PWJ50591.1 2-dehydro-3-deoxyphosphogluconate aldolase/(4S)-4-hydroxy-2-oxoglutarate aldolase [Faecalicatena contorta]SUQ13999.1 2-dehydro-3-deoxyphosphogluconate aldolase / (4S)-4-hydroxy-2-oxoglutarate aldolase [Faecalicatena contorta]